MPQSSLSNDELMTRLRNGDQAALAELFSRHRSRLWRMVNFRLDRRLAGRVDADDILQETYLNAAQRVNRYLEDEAVSLFLWLRSLALQTLIDAHRRHLKSQKRDAGREVSIDRKRYPQATSISIASHLLGHLTSPSQAAMRAELGKQLETALEQLEPIDHEVLALRHFEELTNSEVAEELGIEQKAASIRYVRALKRLKKVIEQIPSFEDL